MKFNFKQISAVVASVMLGITGIAGAMAAAYPQPFVENSTGDFAVVYGSNAAVSDQTQAQSIADQLQNMVSSGATVVEGENKALFTGSSKIWMNETLSGFGGQTTFTDTELPTILADGDFEGDVSADYTQVIKIGSTPQLVYGKHPTTDDEPTPAITFGTSAQTAETYNLTVTFDKTVNFTDSDSIGEKMTLFGKEYTVGASTDSDDLYLYESSETISLSIGGTDPSSTTVTVEGETYTVTLISASDTTATIQVTDSSGNSQSKEIAEDNSKKVQGIDVAVDLADEDTATNRLLAQITVGANKLKLRDGSAVKEGANEKTIRGTYVTATYTGGWNATTGFTISVAAKDTSSDALVQGDSFVDPIFGSFSLVFEKLAGDDDRETFTISPSSDKATLEFTTHSGDTKKIYWYYNDSATARLADSDDSGNDVFNLFEGNQINVTEYVVVGNEDKGYLLELYDFDNDTDSTDDNIVFRDAFNPDNTYKVSAITTEGQGNLIVGGQTYTVNYYDLAAEGADYVTLDYPDSSSNDKVIYPTIESSKGALVSFYEPITLNLSTDLASGSSLKFPDGDGYTDITLTLYNGTAGNTLWNVTGSATALNTSNSTDVVDVSIGQLTYQLQGTGTDNSTTIELEDVGGTAITLPGIVIFEEKAQSSISAADEKYHALIVKMEGSGTSNAKVGVEDVETTWNSDGSNTNWDNLQSEEDGDIYYDFDLWGTLVTTDRSDSDSYSATISYPDEQVNAEVYVAKGASTTGVDVGNVLVKDSEVSAVQGKNLIVVGGSCINTVAAKLLGSDTPLCGDAWTAATDVGEGQLLIQSFENPYQTGKIAVLVAGYEAADTIAGASRLINQPSTIDTSVGNKYVYNTGTEGTSTCVSGPCLD